MASSRSDDEETDRAQWPDGSVTGGPQTLEGCIAFLEREAYAADVSARVMIEQYGASACAPMQQRAAYLDAIRKVLEAVRPVWPEVKQMIRRARRS